jgi:rare lipoprotein A
MANGQRFTNGYTCASRHYRLGSTLCVINPDNHKRVIVKVTDRISKKYADRIDLSKRAFGEIANHKQGVVSVKVEVLDDN